jgi:hypothetical protein
MKKFKLKDKDMSFCRKLLSITMHTWIDDDLIGIDTYQQISDGIKFDSNNQTIVIIRTVMTIRDNLENFFRE